MGQCSSTKLHLPHRDHKRGKIVTMQSKMQNIIKLPVQVQVAHFTPSNFPIDPIVSTEVNKLCLDSWAKILAQKSTNEDGEEINGLVMFYSDFYTRLALFDAQGQFEAVLAAHAGGLDLMSAKGAILVRIIKFVLAIEADSPSTQVMLFMLGKAHTQRHIRPWQYSVFINCLLNTMALRLGDDGTVAVMGAWVNMFAFVLQSMLPAAIQGLVVETECSVATSSEFQEGQLAEEIRVAESLRKARKGAYSEGKTSRGGLLDASSRIDASTRSAWE